MVNPATNRRGGSRFGCLFPLVLLVLLCYLGLKFGRPWFANEQFQDEIASAAKFATTLSDSAMRVRINARADSLRLPKAARGNLRITRLLDPQRILIETEYEQVIVLPFLDPVVMKFHPKAEEGL